MRLRTLLFVMSIASPASAVTIPGASGMTISVQSSGTYEITLTSPAWRFAGTTPAPVSNLVSTSGADSLGAYNEISFDIDTARHASLRAWTERSGVLFTVKYTTASDNTVAFPNFTAYPRDMRHLTFNGTFAPPSFWYFAPESPWIFFDASANSFILSPAANFMAASSTHGAQGELAAGIDSTIAVLPQGFEHSTLLVTGQGINHTFDTWGRTLTTMYGKTLPTNDADASLNKLGYWTDNGATYYYSMANKMTYEQTLYAVKSDFDRLGIGLGYVQLDSWFYPKGSDARWTSNGSGMYEYVAASPPFPAGLGAFQRNLGVPLITHARWVDENSPYRKTYKMSGNVVTDPAYWQNTAAYLANAGAATYEQDWLNDKAHTDFNLTDGAAFLDNMAAAMAQRSLTMQYCMASPRHLMQGARYSNLTTARTSADRLGRDRWTDFLYSSRLASSLGIWPFTDNFLSSETTHMLLATLSAGPLGVGDPVGGINGPNLLRAVRKDGVIVKPDVPLTPIDASYLNMADRVDVPQIASTYSDFGGLRAHYIFAFTQGTNATARFKPSDIGVSEPVYLFDPGTGKGEVLAPGATVERSVQGDALYLQLSPIGPSGLAILGDLDHFVPLGKKRIPALSDDGDVHLTVSFAAGELARTIHGYSPKRPVAHATEGAAGPITYDPATGHFSLAVTPGASGSASVTVQPLRMHRPLNSR